MSSDDLELFWALLERSKYDELKSNIPKNFCWNIFHPVSKITPLVAALQFPVFGRNDKEILNIIEFLVRSGASLSQKCGKSDSQYSLWKQRDRENTQITIKYSGHSIMSWIEAWQKQIEGNREWKEPYDYSAFLHLVLERIAKASGQRQNRRPRASVDEGIVEIWEKSLLAAASHDLTIEAYDGRVTAHSHMLAAASSVVRAMLGSPMKERQTQQIQLKDTNSSAVALFLEALYTCSSQGDPDYKTALSALDLAHRWQVEAVVAVLADLIEGLITEESFPAVAEHAALKGLDTLKKACQSFGSQNAATKERIGKGQFPKIVQDLFIDQATSQPVKKRKRL